jgi:hypothetical protein
MAGDNSVAKAIAQRTLQQAMADLDRAQAKLERLGRDGSYTLEYKDADREVQAAARRYRIARDHLEEFDR